MSVRYIILGLLQEKPRHVYEIYAAFQDLIGNEQARDIKPAQIYTTVARLAEKGLVSLIKKNHTAGEDRLMYTLTGAGQETLAQWLSLPCNSTYLRSDFYHKLILCINLQPDALDSLISSQRAVLREEMRTITAMRSQVDSQSNLKYSLLLDLTLSHLELDLRWLDKLEVWRRQLLNQPTNTYISKRRGRPAKEVL